MKILHSSDLHGDYHKLLKDFGDADFDVWIDTGDFFPNRTRGGPDEPRYQTRWFKNKQLGRRLTEWLAGRPLISVPGNHDYVSLAKLMREGKARAYEATPGGVVVDRIRYAGFRQIPYIHGEWVGETRPGGFEEAIEKVFADPPHILLTHAGPAFPRRSGMPEMTGSDDHHGGIGSLTTALSFRPHKIKAHFFGHDHQHGSKTRKEMGVLFSNSATKPKIVTVPGLAVNNPRKTLRKILTSLLKEHREGSPRRRLWDYGDPSRRGLETFHIHVVAPNGEEWVQYVEAEDATDAKWRVSNWYAGGGFIVGNARSRRALSDEEKEGLERIPKGKGGIFVRPEDRENPSKKRKPRVPKRRSVVHEVHILKTPKAGAHTPKKGKKGYQRREKHQKKMIENPYRTSRERHNWEVVIAFTDDAPYSSRRGDRHVWRLKVEAKSQEEAEEKAREEVQWSKYNTGLEIISATPIERSNPAFQWGSGEALPRPPSPWTAKRKRKGEWIVTGDPKGDGPVSYVVRAKTAAEAIETVERRTSWGARSVALRNSSASEVYDPRNEQRNAHVQGIYEGMVLKMLGLHKDPRFRDSEGKVIFRDSKGMRLDAKHGVVGPSTWGIQGNVTDVSLSKKRHRDVDHLILNRQDYEETLGLQRQKGFYRYTKEPTKDGFRYFVWPMPPGVELPMWMVDEAAAEEYSRELSNRHDPRRTGKWWKPPRKKYTRSEVDYWLPPASVFKS